MGFLPGIEPVQLIEIRIVLKGFLSRSLFILNSGILSKKRDWQTKIYALKTFGEIRAQNSNHAGRKCPALFRPNSANSGRFKIPLSLT